MNSAARATAVAAAVAAVVDDDDHDGASHSQLEALNLMLPRSVSITLGGKSDCGHQNDKTGCQIHGEGDSRAHASTCVLHGYEALRAIRARAHRFRTGALGRCKWQVYSPQASGP